MRITKRQLRRIIKEEKTRLLRESEKWDHLDAYGNPKDGPKLYGPGAAAAGVGVAAQKMVDKSSPGASAGGFDGSLMDLEDYQRLENMLQKDLKVFLRDGYTKDDILEALKSIVEDA